MAEHWPKMSNESTRSPDGRVARCVLSKSMKKVDQRERIRSTGMGEEIKVLSYTSCPIRTWIYWRNA